jgi:hypothetical protein
VTPTPLWRVFPWNPDAAEGERFSAAFVLGGQGNNRFDLVGDPRGVIYLAETEDHAVAEMIQGLRNGSDPLTTDDLTVWGHRYAIVSATLDPTVWSDIADLCEPSTLASIEITAERPAMRDRSSTQRIAATLYERGHAGLRWWSAFWGEWHSVVLFRDRLSAGALIYGQPVPLDVSTPAVQSAAHLLDID